MPVDRPEISTTCRRTTLDAIYTTRSLVEVGRDTRRRVADCLTAGPLQNPGAIQGRGWTRLCVGKCVPSVRSRSTKCSASPGVSKPDGPEKSARGRSLARAETGIGCARRDIHDAGRRQNMAAGMGGPNTLIRYRI